MGSLRLGVLRAPDPKSRLDFWQKKFAANVTRDARTTSALAKTGWLVLTVWECEVQSQKILRAVAARIRRHSALTTSGSHR